MEVPSELYLKTETMYENVVPNHFGSATPAFISGDVLSPLTVQQQELDEVKLEDEITEWVEKHRSERNAASRRPRRRSHSPDVAPRDKDSKRRGERDKSSSKRKKQKNGSRHDDNGRSKKKKKKSKSETRKKKRRQSAQSDDSTGNSEPEEGEITESEREESTPSSTSSSSPSNESPEAEMETQCQAGETANKLQSAGVLDLTYSRGNFKITLVVTSYFILSALAYRGHQVPLATNS